ncbi:hypothetical protein [Candidatus Albibeggiatoa sp. nov. BB20]|uniref:hypothetical protein n=1 Tax=Candidatus Albibeggiatoa sp. nov. BB20 TaxID=3162723 RepID=UPI0033654211
MDWLQRFFYSTQVYQAGIFQEYLRIQKTCCTLVIALDAPDKGWIVQLISGMKQVAEKLGIKIIGVV